MLDGSIGIAKYAEAITPADSDLDQPVAALYIGGDGNVRVTTSHGQDVTFTGMLVGTFLPVKVKRVWSTNTTATNLIGLR